MIANDKLRFAQCFNRLAVALRLPAGDGDAAMKQIYFDALGAYPIDAVEDAARLFARDAQWFPKTSEWVAGSEQARSTRVLTKCLPVPRADPWKSECETCDDTGWEYLACDGSDQCGRTKAHAKHPYVVPCGCRGVNRTYQRKIEEQNLQASRRKAAGKQHTSG